MEICFSQFRKLESEIRVLTGSGTGRARFWAGRQLPGACILTWWGERELSAVSLDKDTNPVGSGPHSFDLIYS